MSMVAAVDKATRVAAAAEVSARRHRLPKARRTLPAVRGGAGTPMRLLTQAYSWTNTEAVSCISCCEGTDVPMMRARIVSKAHRSVSKLGGAAAAWSAPGSTPRMPIISTISPASAKFTGGTTLPIREDT